MLALAVIPPTAVLHRGLLGRQTESVALPRLKNKLAHAVEAGSGQLPRPFCETTVSPSACS